MKDTNVSKLVNLAIACADNRCMNVTTKVFDEISQRAESLGGGDKGEDAAVNEFVDALLRRAYAQERMVKGE